MSLNLTGNNLIPYPFSNTISNNGITATYNDDGSVTLNGTATADAYFWNVGKTPYLKAGTYTVSGCPTGGSRTTYAIVGSRWIPLDVGNGSTFTTDEDGEKQLGIFVKKNTTVKNLVFKPMLNKGTTALPYEPYKSINPENIKVNMSNNLIVYPYRYSDLNYNGIAYTTNDNGEIIANGCIEDNTKYSQFSLNASSKIFNIQKDIYTMSCPMSINDKSHEALFLLDFYLDGSWKFTHSVNNTTLLTKTIDLREKEFNQVYGYIRISQNATGTFENFTFKPMLNKGTTALPYEPYIAPKDVEKVVVAKSPNLIVFDKYKQQLISGVTFTYNDDGSVTANGTATADAYLYPKNPVDFKAGSYTVSGCPTGGSRTTYAIVGSGWIPLDVGNGSTFTVDSDTSKSLMIYIHKGVTVENLTFYPMLNKGTTALPYQKYDREVVWSKTSTSDETTDEETTV